MRTTQIVLFCAISLALSLGLATLLYPYARLPAEVVEASQTPQPMEDFDQVIDLGEDFGPMTIIELMGYYLDNPPQPETGAAAIPKRQFGGC